VCFTDLLTCRFSGTAPYNSDSALRWGFVSIFWILFVEVSKILFPPQAFHCNLATDFCLESGRGGEKMPYEVLKTLQSARHQRGMSLQELAEKMGTTKSQVDKLEKGERRLTVEWLLKMAEALHLSPATVFGAEQESSSWETVASPAVTTLEESPHGDPYQSYPLSSTPPPSSWWGAALNDLARCTPTMLPIFVKADPETGILRLHDTPSSFVPRPPSLFGVPSAFALYVPDHRYQPRFEAGDLLYINPERPLREGRWALVASVHKEVTLMPFAAAVVKAERRHGVGVVVGIETA
jgi:transcriptional regulator with XRE-family HTH domain